MKTSDIDQVACMCMHMDQLKFEQSANPVGTVDPAEDRQAVIIWDPREGMTEDSDMS